ncbi:MAG: hypothetical protein HYT89_03150 [Candidatus Omnitrophica bacterium]|nr:hypothetical protein [Candidatus Omnitrophota bacterium]
MFLVSFLSGCGPRYTYPAGKVPESIEKICRKEYKIDAQARVAGKTVGALLLADFRPDSNGQIPKEIHEKMGQVLQAVTRVALSTDLPLDFCTVVVRDKSQGHELVITRSLDDTKRANAEALGMEESMNRTVFGQGKAAPGTESFALKDITLADFLTEQIVQRIRFNFAKEAQGPEEAMPEEAAIQSAVLADGSFHGTGGLRTFRFSILSLKSADPKATLLEVFKTANAVLEGYRYRDFDGLEIQDYLNRQKLVIDKETLEAYQKKAITAEEIFERYLVESASIQEVFKLFGFTIPQDSAASASASPTP